jgi:hypothetical protein
MKTIIIGTVLTILIGLTSIGIAASSRTWEANDDGSMILPTNIIPIQRARAQTDTSGVYTWTYGVPYASGTIPIVSAIPEDTTVNSAVDVKITSRSSTSTRFQVSKTANVDILGIMVTQLIANPQVFLHLVAMEP